MPLNRNRLLLHACVRACVRRVGIFLFHLSALLWLAYSKINWALPSITIIMIMMASPNHFDLMTDLSSGILHSCTARSSEHLHSLLQRFVQHFLLMIVVLWIEHALSPM